MFIVAAEVYVFGAILYVILAEGKRQWWAGGERRKRSMKKCTGDHHDNILN